jgi:hypothetical protein
MDFSCHNNTVTMENQAERFARLYYNNEAPFLQSAAARVDPESLSREERIDLFNRDVEKTRAVNPANGIVTTHDFQKKSSSAGRQLGTLRPLDIADLQVEKTHRGRAVYGRIVSKALVLRAKTILLEDATDLVPLSIYGNIDAKDLQEGRRMAIKEPFFKVRADGTKGIRVDHPKDLEFDVSPHQTNAHVGETLLTPKSVSERMRELLDDDSSIGVNRLYKCLLEEGYSVDKKRIRKLKTEMLRNPEQFEGKGGNDTSLILILSKRNPKKNRASLDPQMMSLKEQGNEAFKSNNMKEAEKFYSSAIEKRGEMLIASNQDTSKDAVFLWQLYSNRSTARIRLGNLVGALHDALASNVCAPMETTRPIMRCAEALAALGMKQELAALLQTAADSYPQDARELLAKENLLAPNCSFRVGKNRDFSSIAAALLVAPAGSEILVDPGVYRETLYISKPISIRNASLDNDQAAIQALEGNGNTRWVTIEVENRCAVVCSPNSHRKTPSHFIGLEIICKGPPFLSVHAAFVTCGIAVFRNCLMTSSSGPVVATENSETVAIFQSCAIRNGAQGGILAVGLSHLSLHQVYSCHHAASGLELRAGATCSIEGCHLYANGRQGVLAWKKAGSLTAKNSFFHSNQQESGVMVSESEAWFESCWIYGNAMAGVVAQDKGSLSVYKCEIHDNLEGVLIQDTGSARVEQCEVFSNRSNGIFVGFDHRGNAAIVDNHVHDNQSKGIFVANAGKVVVRNNKEEKNRGLPPLLPSHLSGRPVMKRADPKHLKRMKKNAASIKQAIQDDKPCSPFDALLKSYKEDMGDAMLAGMEKLATDCSFCRASPKQNQVFPKCSRCKAASYCSPKCQKLHWTRHKESCRDRSIKYPMFLDPDSPLPS